MGVAKSRYLNFESDRKQKPRVDFRHAGPLMTGIRQCCEMYCKPFGLTRLSRTERCAPKVKTGAAGNGKPLPACSSKRTSKPVPDFVGTGHMQTQRAFSDAEGS